MAAALGILLLICFGVLTAVAWRRRAALAGTLAVLGTAACIGALAASASAVLWIAAPFAPIAAGLVALGSLSARLLGEDDGRD
jgi:CHASE2 domain-containing sensor protein